MPAVVQSLLPYQIFNSSLEKVKLYPWCKLAALPPNPMPIHTILQLQSAVSPALQHPLHPSASLMTPLPQHSLQKAMSGA